MRYDDSIYGAVEISEPVLQGLMKSDATET